MIFKVALPGIPVKEATPEQCAIHSGYNSPKIDATKDHFLNINIFFASEPPDPTLGNSNTTILHSFPHEYDYEPRTWLHCDYISEFGALPTTVEEFGPGRAYLGGVTIADPCFLGIKTNETNYQVYIQKFNGSGSPLQVLGSSVKLRLYIFAEEF